MVDWDSAFAALKIWPCNCSDEQIARQTPRQTFAIWNQLQQMTKAIGGSDREAAPTPAEDAADDGEPKVGVQAVKGLGMDRVEYWQPQPGEKEAEQAMQEAGFRPGSDPFSVSREVIRERTYAMVVKACGEGQLLAYGVPHKDFAAARDFFDRVWSANSRKFEELTRLFMRRDSEAGERIGQLAEEGQLENFGIERGDRATALRWFEFVANKYASQLDALKEKSNVVRNVPSDHPGVEGQAG